MRSRVHQEPSRPGRGSSSYVDVLIVDDNDQVRASCASVLVDAGYCVLEAENGAVAFEVLRSRDIGAIILDIGMPVLDGFGLLDRLQDPPPILLLTARGYDREVMERLDKVFLYLRKPTPPPDLLEAVALAVAAGSGRRAERQEEVCPES